MIRNRRHRHPPHETLATLRRSEPPAICPVCGSELTNRRCKLICRACGYMES